MVSEMVCSTATASGIGVGLRRSASSPNSLSQLVESRFGSTHCTATISRRIGSPGWLPRMSSNKSLASYGRREFQLVERAPARFPRAGMIMARTSPSTYHEFTPNFPIDNLVGPETRGRRLTRPAPRHGTAQRAAPDRTQLVSRMDLTVCPETPDRPSGWLVQKLN